MAVCLDKCGHRGAPAPGDLRLTAMLIHILYTGPDIYIIQKRGDPGIFGTQTWALWFYLDSMEGYQLHSVILQEVISCLL